MLTDDLEMYNRIAFGLSSAGSEWIEIGRGFQSDRPDEHGGRRGKNSTSEVYIRNMFDAWLDFMATEPAAWPGSPACDDVARRRRASGLMEGAPTAPCGTSAPASDRPRRMRTIPDARSAPAG